MSSEVLNIEAIANAIKKHNKTCKFPATAVVMNPFEVERLDWDEILGVSIIGDANLPTGRFRILCDGITDGSGVKEEESVEEPLEVISPDYDRELVPA